MKKERHILLQLGFHGILGKLVLNFEVLSFQDLLALREKIKVALIVVGCFILSDSTGLAYQDLGEGKIIRVL